MPDLYVSGRTPEAGWVSWDAHGRWTGEGIMPDEILTRHPVEKPPHFLPAAERAAWNPRRMRLSEFVHLRARATTQDIERAAMQPSNALK